MGKGGEATFESASSERVFAGDGEMAALMRSIDWSQTLGSPDQWPQSLKTSIRIMLGSRYPMFVWWGETLTNFYNDDYIPILGQRHPWALSQPAAQVWAEIWQTLEPQAEAVLRAGQASWNEAVLLTMERNGYTEETYFTFSYSPVPNDDGGVGGVFCACTEETRRVLSDRRLQTLRELAAQTIAAKTVADACEISVQTLANNPYDLPFALLYLLDETATQARLVSTTGLAAGTPASPRVSMQAEDDRWELAAVLQTGEPRLISLESIAALPGGVWPEPARMAAVLPLTASTQAQPIGFLVAGISPRREFDDDYKGFFDLVAGQIAATIASAQAYAAERQRSEALAELDRAKTAFFSNVSHEFRTPLTLMLSPLEDLLAIDDAPQREQLQLIQRNGLRLLKLVNSLLDFSRIEAGRVQAAYEPVDLAIYTAELASTFRSLIERAQLSLIVDCPPLPALVYVDREMWEKIVFNLLSNAFKFTLSGTITVRLRGLGDRVELAIIDTGVGIPPEELPHLFERFHRVENSQGRSFEGSGIGLSLVQELVKLHQGAIQVSSTLGQGSQFMVTIPTGAALPADRIGVGRATSTAVSALPYVEEAQRWLPQPSDRSEDWSLQSSIASLTPYATAEPTVKPTVKPTVEPTVRAQILLADDNADMRDYIRRLLSKAYRVETVADGAAAWSAIQDHPPDLVLTDVMMPTINGFELLRSLRSDPQTQAIPLILLSARAGEEARLEGLAAGADDYLIKPFSAKELLARVEATLKLSQLRQEALQQEQALRTASLISQQEAEVAFRRLDQLLDSMSEAFVALDRDWHIIYQNATAERINNKPRSEVLGKTLWEEWPAAIGSISDRQYRYAVAHQVAVHFEQHYYEPPDHDVWLEVHAYPFEQGLGIFYRDISDRKRSEQEREQLLQREQAAREAAEAANRIKDEFLAVLSHELRSPLNPILGWSKLLQQGKLDAAKTAAALATIERNAQLQAQLIDDLLDISRILRGKLSLTVLPVDLTQVILAALETVRLAAEAKSLQIHTIFPLDRAIDRTTVMGDSGRLQQVMWNLFSNAVKFTSAGGQITVALTQSDTHAQVQVIDSGKGINPDFLPYVFDHFRQEDGATTRKFGGLGLGLAIARQIVELHGGTIAVESAGEGQGATFTVQIPLSVRSQERPAIVPSSGSTDLIGVRVLVVDDEADSREFVAFVLEQSGAIVTSAASGIDALQAISRSTPDLIVSDIGMPQMDGYMLMRQIRALPAAQKSQIPAIALTAYAGELDRQQAIAAGFRQHLTKPVEPDQLIEAIARLVSQCR